RLELRAVEKGIDRITDTTRIVVVLVVVGEGAPLGSGIDDSVAQNEAARGADHVTRRKLLDKVRGKLATVGALVDLVEVLLPLLRFGRLRCAVNPIGTCALGSDEGL